MTWGLAAVLAAVAAAPFLREAMRRRIDTDARRAAPGSFVELSRGVTHYCWLGADDGPVVVCVHGLTTPSYVWMAVARGLGAMGFRVLVYDLYGRGFSDRPRGLQDGDFFVRQLEELLECLKVAPGFTLMGYSMGGAIAACFAARHPARLRRLVLLAPAGMGHDLGPAARLMARTGTLGTWFMLLVYARSYRRATEAERGLDTPIDGIVDRQQAELRYRGFIPSVLASLRGILDEPLKEVHGAIAESGIPVLAIWGGADEVIPPEGRDVLAAWNPQARQVVIEGAGHALAYTEAEAVLAAMDQGERP